MRTPMPSLDGAAAWVNGPAPTVEDLANHPVLVHFWSVSCYICHNVADVVAGWRDKYEPLGLKVIAIHQPRNPDELDVQKVTADAHGEMGITQPLAIDNTHAIVKAFENEFVPAYYLFDAKHELIHRQAGDRGFERLEAKIDEALAAAGGAAEPESTQAVA
jgi:thiol-disulfide isomerase/thioredoxin